MRFMRVVFSGFLLFTSIVSWAAIAPPPASNAVPGNAVESATGLYYLVLKPAASGAANLKPAFFEYRVTAWKKNDAGKLKAIESGVLRSNIRTVSETAPALARAAMMSPVGESRRWWFTFGDDPSLTQIVDLTVLGNVDPAPAPSDVAAVPADATKTASGLAYRVIKKGDGKVHPGPQSMLTIHYSGWTADGKLFDSSVVRDKKADLQLSTLIPGWKEGIPLMVVGDTYRFWVPGYLAYDSIPNSNGPKGMLVFDVTLFGFEN